LPQIIALFFFRRIQMIAKEKIKKGLDEAFKKAGQNAYFGNGFEAGIKFAEEYYQKNNKKLQTKAHTRCSECGCIVTEVFCYECGEL
jgi:hypothetical protein